MRTRWRSSVTKPMVPVSLAKLLVSPTSRVDGLSCFSRASSFLDAMSRVTNRIWQFGSGFSLIRVSVIGRLRVLRWVSVFRVSVSGMLPSTQILSGASGVGNVLSGQLTNLVKLYRYTSLTSYSVGLAAGSRLAASSNGNALRHRNQN